MEVYLMRLCTSCATPCLFPSYSGTDVFVLRDVSEESRWVPKGLIAHWLDLVISSLFYVSFYEDHNTLN